MPKPKFGDIFEARGKDKYKVMYIGPSPVKEQYGYMVGISLDDVVRWGGGTVGHTPVGSIANYDINRFKPSA